MKIRLVCQKHPHSNVYLLEGSIKYIAADGDYISEHMERATTIEIDEGNLYCNGGDGEHDFLDVKEWQ